MTAQPAWGAAAVPALHLVTGDASGQLAGILAEWRLWQESANLSERTITDRARTITALVRFAGVAPLELTPGHIIKFLARPSLSKNSRNTYSMTAHAFCRYLAVTGQRVDNPALQTPKPRRVKGVPRPVTPEQVAAVLAVANRRRTRMMLLLASFAGLRVHEIAKIRGEDLDLSAGILYVVGKGAKPATLPLHPLILADAGKFPATGWWFPSYKNGGPVRVSAVSKTIHDAFERADVQATPHQLRHFYGTALCRNGVNLRVVQELMRHSSLATTAIYTQVSDEQRRDAIRGLFADAQR